MQIKLRNTRSENFMHLGTQTNPDQVDEESLRLARAWAPRKAKSLTITGLVHTDYHGCAAAGPTGYADFCVYYFSTLKEGEHLVRPMVEPAQPAICKLLFTRKGVLTMGHKSQHRIIRDRQGCILCICPTPDNRICSFCHQREEDTDVFMLPDVRGYRVPESHGDCIDTIFADEPACEDPGKCKGCDHLDCDACHGE